MGVGYRVNDMEHFLGYLFFLGRFNILQRGQNQMAGNDVSIGRSFWLHSWGVLRAIFEVNIKRMKHGHLKINLDGQCYYLFHI